MKAIRDNKGLEVGLYKDMEEWQALSGIDDYDKEDYMEKGNLREITCGTYNGATHEFTPWEVTKDNLVETILRDAGETDYISGVWEDSYSPTSEEVIESYCSNYEVFALDDGTVWTFKN